MKRRNRLRATFAMTPVNAVLATRNRRISCGLFGRLLPAATMTALLIFGLQVAQAQDGYPQKPVRWITSVLAGGAACVIKLSAKQPALAFLISYASMPNHTSNLPYLRQFDCNWPVTVLVRTSISLAMPATGNSGLSITR